MKKPSVATSGLSSRPLSPIPARMSATRGCGDAVEKSLRTEDAKGSSEDAQQERLADHEAHHVSAREAEGLQNADLGAPLAHRHAHGVCGDEKDGEGHGEADAV